MAPSPNLGALANLWIWSLQVLPPICWAFQLISSLLGSGSLLLSGHLALSVGYPLFLITHCYTHLFKFLTLNISSSSPSMPDLAPNFPLPASLHLLRTRMREVFTQSYHWCVILSSMGLNATCLYHHGIWGIGWCSLRAIAL